VCCANCVFAVETHTNEGTVAPKLQALTLTSNGTRQSRNSPAVKSTTPALCCPVLCAVLCCVPLQLPAIDDIYGYPTGDLTDVSGSFIQQVGFIGVTIYCLYQGTMAWYSVHVYAHPGT
jgi:hypothetical protein